LQRLDVIGQLQRRAHDVQRYSLAA
jgi:hypothetical protein